MNYTNISILKTAVGWTVIATPEGTTTPEIKTYNNFEEIVAWIEAAGKGQDG